VGRVDAFASRVRNGRTWRPASVPVLNGVYPLAKRMRQGEEAAQSSHCCIIPSAAKPMSVQNRALARRLRHPVAQYELIEINPSESAERTVAAGNIVDYTFY
jgi:hypothetical protein